MAPPFNRYYDRSDWTDDESDELDELDNNEINSYFPLDNLLLRTNRDPSNKPYLQNLRRVYFINCAPTYISHFYEELDFYSCLELIDHLPSIESVNTDLLGDGKEGKHSLDPGSSNVSRIVLNHSCIGHWWLNDVVKSCKTLREFRYSIGGRGTRYRADSNVNPKRYVKILLEHKETLEVLDLDIQSAIRVLRPGWKLGAELYYQSFDVFRDGPSWWEEKENGWLKSFSALKRLSLGVNLLMYYTRGVIKEYATEDFNLVDCLPESLEYLCIRGYERGRNPDIDAQVDRLMAVKETGALNLKEIEGVEKCIPNAEHVEGPNNRDKLWRLEENWTGKW